VTRHPRATAPPPMPVVDPADSTTVRIQPPAPEIVPVSFRELEGFVLPREGRTIVGIAGAPAAGKSTAATRLVADWNDCHGPMDGFHLSNAQLARLGLTARKGAPETFDASGFVAILDRVRNSTLDIYAPDYDRNLHEPVAARHLIPARALLVVVEGNYLGMAEHPWTQVRGLLDILWWLEESDEVREGRLLARQMAGGRAPTDARHWVETVDRPNADLINLSRSAADATVTTASLAVPADPSARL
jgi:pantothenate kinase